MARSTAGESRRKPGKAAASSLTTARRAAGDDPAGAVTFPIPDRLTRSGHIVGDICFECECRIVEIGGPEGLLLAWCECGYPDDHADMEITQEPVRVMSVASAVRPKRERERTSRFSSIPLAARASPRLPTRPASSGNSDLPAASRHVRD